MINYKQAVVQKDLSLIVGQTNINWEKLRNKTILITGVSGMLATYLAYTLVYLNETRTFNIKIIGTARNMSKAEAKFDGVLSDHFELLQHDVTMPFDCDDSVDYIIHAASSASPKFITADPVGIIKANAIGTINLLEFARNQHLENFLFLSTREIYGKAISTHLTEEDYGGFDILAPRACYPESKRMAETLLESYYVQYDLPYTIARIAHSYGPGMELGNDGRIMNDLISNVVRNQDIILKSDGSAERAFCYLADATSALFTVLLNGKIANAYNVANEDEPVSIRELSEKLVKLFPEKNLSIKFDIPKTQSSAYSKDGRTVMEMTKIEKMGWRRLVKLEEGLKKTVESFK